MIAVRFDYASPSALHARRDGADLNLSASRRRPVRFHGRVKRELFHLRIALRALGDAIWSNDSWLSEGDLTALDPIITVHPDRIFFEAFSQDQSAYVLLILDPDLFETDGDTQTGTTNVDFSAWLWGALGELRSSRPTDFRIDSAGFEVQTLGAGGRFEPQVELPEAWVRGFLYLQAAMAMPGTRLTVRPVDVLAAVRYLRYTKAKVSPRALRYEFEPGHDAALVLEPWEARIPLVGAAHTYAEPRAIRTWGRRRLKLIEPLLPFAESVDIYLKGRALPSFYAVKLPGITFVLGLSGWSSQAWTDAAGFDVRGEPGPAESSTVLTDCLEHLRSRYSVTAPQLAEAAQLDLAKASHALQTLCRQGRAMYDLESRAFRHRELFEIPIDLDTLYPPDIRHEQVARLLAENAVVVQSCDREELRKVKRFVDPQTGTPTTREVIYPTWRAIGSAAEQTDVQVVVNDEGRVIFGVCACPFFSENHLNLGPCAHIAALYRASEDRRVDLPVSHPAEPEERNADGDETDDED